jgi:hypothetical protein
VTQRFNLTRYPVSIIARRRTCPLILQAAEGYRLQILGEPQSDPFVLLGKLVQKMMRALSMEHLHEDASGLQVAGTMVRGRIEWNGVEGGRLPCVVIDGRRVEWNDFGAILMAFEGWQFRLELLDPTDEA